MKQAISNLMFKKFLNCRPAQPPYHLNADFDWIQAQSGLPWIQLSINVPYDTISQELSGIESLMTTHRDQYSDTQGWKSFCIHGKSYNATREDSYYNDKRPYVWTPEAEQLMPKTTEYFKNIWPALQYHRLRVMLLEPGGYIGIHRDSEISQLSAINLAITQPKNCEFIFEHHGPIPFTQGSAFWLDISNNHTVFNHSDTPRWHIIIHQKYNTEFKDLVVKSYKNMYNSINENSHNHNP